MHRDEIVAKLKAAGGGGLLIVSALNLFERAGLTIIPATPDEAEIERVARAIDLHNCNWDNGLDGELKSMFRRKARAAAAAVRPYPSARSVAPRRYSGWPCP